MNKNKIPHGIYCYDSKGLCPYWNYKQITHDRKDEDYEPISIPYCSYLNEGDLFNLTKEQFKELLRYFNCTKEELWEKFPLDLLWDQVKECGINDYEEK